MAAGGLNQVLTQDMLCERAFRAFGQISPTGAFGLLLALGDCRGARGEGPVRARTEIFAMPR